MFFYSPRDLLILLPALLLGLWAQGKVQRAYSAYSAVPTRKGLPARQVAEILLDTYGNSPVDIQPIKGQLTDHYNPATKSLGLSQGVYDSSSVSAIAIAAHEIGHAMQDQSDYSPLRLRSALVPVINFSSNVYWLFIILGFLLSFDSLILVGIIFFGLSFVFSLVTLPVEFNASNRALAMLGETNLLTAEELPQAKAVLNAAALTYVAATFSALAQLLRLLLIRNDRRE
ncbi:MAG: zinc metallopeptidase [Clostridiales bacterium]|nr:zinc metallopeptidase [Clostridiales bacterium]